MQELCLRYAISRKTGYKGIARVAEEDRRGLAERSRAPHSCPHQTSDAVAASSSPRARRTPTGDLFADDCGSAHTLLLTCHGLTSVHGALARPLFEQTFREYGLPRAIRTDNDAPLITRAPCGLSFLNVFWMRLGLQHNAFIRHPRRRTAGMNARIAR